MASSTYTNQQLNKRDTSKWTIVQGILAPLQFIAFVTSFVLILHYLRTGEGYQATNISVVIKIGLLWVITITGMFWEKEIYGKWFLAPEFFWEDFMNAVALFFHNLYFVVLALGWSEVDIMKVMMFAYVTYLINFAQFFYKGLQARKQRMAAFKAGY